MNRKRKIIIITLALLTAGCGSPRPTADATTGRRYERPPLREVSEEQLRLDTRLIDAVTLQETGHTDEALTAYAALTHDAPEMAAAWYGQSQMLMQRNWTDSARRCAERAATLEPKNDWYLMALAQCCAACGDAKGHEAAWQRLAELHPERTEYSLQLADARLQAGDAAGAIDALNHVEHRIGVTEMVSMQKSRIWEAMGKSDKATGELQRLADAMPRTKRYQATMAQRCMQRKDYKKARQYYDRILASDPDDEYIHVQLAEYYKAQGKTAEADSEMVLAFANPRLEARTKMQLLTSFYSEEEFYGKNRNTCFRLMEMVARDSDNPSEVAVYYGDVLMKQRRFDEAATQLALALQHDSSRYEVWEGLLICLTEVPAREAELSDYARRAERLFPMHTLPHHLVGLTALRHEQFAEAVEALEKAVRWGFNRGYLEAETYGLLAEAYYRNNQYDKAWPMFDKYLDMRPQDWGTMNNYAWYLAQQGTQLEKAERLSRRTVDAEPENANSLDTYAWILHLLGRDAEALPYAQRAVQLDPKSMTLQDHLKTISQ